MTKSAENGGNQQLSAERPDDEMVTVCDQCLRASCWQGSFYCERYKGAGTVHKSRRVLRKLAKESEDYWV